MLKAKYKKHILDFNFPGGTSRGVLHKKPSWYLMIEDEKGNIGVGEVSIIPGLSLDDEQGMDSLLEDVCANINEVVEDYLLRYRNSPALCFAIEMALAGMKNQSPFVLFDSDFTKGNGSIKINGLIWMGDVESMNRQIETKLELGFSCLKIKIGALHFEEEIKVLESIRKRFSKDALELRVDANGAFQPGEANEKLERLAKLNLHSIEQPIKAGQWEKMAGLCASTPLPIALDEELIGVQDEKQKKQLLDVVKPQFIILKPSLLGGFKASEEWINLADERKVGWWVTSALEGNIGLNAIAQWTYTLHPSMPQGLGTGQVFKNNIASPLYLNGDKLCYNLYKDWQNPFDKI